MLERLEVSIIHLNNLERTKRIDAEFYSTENLHASETMARKQIKSIQDVCLVSDGNHMSISYDFQETGIPYYRGQDTCHTFIEDASPVCISEKSYRLPVMLRSHIHKGDVLLSIVGTVGNSSLVYEDNEATRSCKLAILRPQDKDIYSEYLAVFCKTKYGQNQIQKFRRGTVQTGLLLEDMDQIFVPTLDLSFQEKIVDIIKQMHVLNAQAKGYYSTAENLLLSELGLSEYIPLQEQISVRSFKDLLHASRMDVEYFQPKYDDFEQVIKGYKKGFTTPGNTFELIKTKCSKDLPEYSYVEIGDIDIGNGRAEYNVVPIDELPDNAKIMTQAGDLLVSTVRPYRGAVAILKENNYLVSGAFTVLRERGGYPAETLQVLFRTPIYKDWLLKFNVGTSYPVIKDEDVLNIPIPIFEDDIHDKVRKCIRESHSMISHSKELLETAKCAVEIAIEQDEEMTIKYLEDNLQLK